MFFRRSWRRVFDTTWCDKICQWLAAGRWFPPGTPISSTNKTDRHNVTEILLKVVSNTITLIFNRKNKISRQQTEYSSTKGNLRKQIIQIQNQQKHKHNSRTKAWTTTNSPENRSEMSSSRRASISCPINDTRCEDPFQKASLGKGDLKIILKTWANRVPYGLNNLWRWWQP